MGIEAEVAVQVYRMMELHNNLSNGSFEEMNTFYADDFHGQLYMPWENKVQYYNADQIKQGNKQAAAYYQGEKIKFTYSGLKIIPQSETQAAASYEVTFHQDQTLVRAVALEVWCKASDGKWRIIRWYEEKGRNEI